MKRTVTIREPEVIPAGRGITASRSGGKPTSVRFTRAEHKLIEDVCKRYSMSKMNFIRWCAIHVAAELCKTDGEGDGDNAHLT